MGSAEAPRRTDRAVAGYLALGLLLDGPASGYELVARAERSVAHFWPVTRSALYAELPRLEDQGWVEGADVPQKGHPDKRVYRTTAAGEDAFVDWLTTVDLEERPRHPLQLLLFFAGHAPAEHSQSLLLRWRRRAEQATATCEAILADKGIDPRRLESGPTIDARTLTALFGLRRAQADQAFLDEAAQLLSLES
jgi:DNA-binding PadR family transcriptional regulator